MRDKIIIAIPAYNEEYAIGNVVKGIYDLGMDIDVFVIDDGSNDETLKLAKLHGAEVLRQRINLGGGATIRTAFSLAIRMGVDYLVTLDGDGQHDPGELPLMIDFTLLCMGAGTALIWIINPFAIPLAILPLYLIFTTLKIPALERKTEIDSKTGLYNAKYFSKELKKELERAHNFDRPLTIVLADLDLLRNINNTYGHLAGDEVLIGVANLIKNSLREFDVVARFGGEEFMILMPETNQEEAFEVIEGIRTSIDQTKFSIQTRINPIKVTVSFGVAGRMGFSETPNEIIHNADSALYHSKLTGRNRTCVYTDQGFEVLYEPGQEIPLDQSGLPLANPSENCEPENQPAPLPDKPPQIFLVQLIK